MPSSVVASFKYNPTSKTLRIFYVSGSVYDYKNVPADVYEKMQLAPSKGTFLNREIKNRFGYRRVK